MAPDQLMLDICQHYCVDEAPYIDSLRSSLTYDHTSINEITLQAIELSKVAQSSNQHFNTLQRLLNQFSLSSNEGIALMSLCECLLRIPDKAVASRLISDRLFPIDWDKHIQQTPEFAVKASSLALLISGNVLHQEDSESYAHRLLRKMSQPLLKKALSMGIGHMAKEFVFSETIEDALSKIDTFNIQEHYSFDMLGEAALTAESANAFFDNYQNALKAIQQHPLADRCSLSVKLSALHPRFESLKSKTCIEELSHRMAMLLETNKASIQITLDAEESQRTLMNLEVYEALIRNHHDSPSSAVGIAVQAYSPRALYILKYLNALAERFAIRIPVRLVKGAYWDTEIKQAQVEGLPYYPVYTQKHHTDISYLSCARYLLNNRDTFYPQFATHNASTICDIVQHAQPDESYEFQRLHGMGADIYSVLLTKYANMRVRVYAPIGPHETLLPYLVRRILENGANSSFLMQWNHGESLETVCLHPLNEKKAIDSEIPLPKRIYEPERANSQGINIHNPLRRTELEQALSEQHKRAWELSDVHLQSTPALPEIEIRSPFSGATVGRIQQLNIQQILEAMNSAHAFYPKWRGTSVKTRCNTLLAFANSLQSHQTELVSLLMREAGKTLTDSINEIREAIDFIYYYSEQARELFAETALPSVTGEHNLLRQVGKGVFLCISPWNFPLAIFCGQISAALITGNTVLAKPSSKTPLIAKFAVNLAHKSGIPKEALHLVISPEHSTFEQICMHQNLSGVCFTGSQGSAKSIYQSLSKREGSILPFIAETGGQNAMIVDSSALPEHVVKDIIKSAFYSAGQRCSALRVVYLQEDIADSLITLLCGAIDTLDLGDPCCFDTDIGPVIDSNAFSKLQKHVTSLRAKDSLIHELKLQDGSERHNLFPPCVLKIDSLSDLKSEHFGPILHVIRYRYADIDWVVEDVNNAGFGLTCGIHSRNSIWANELARKLNIGNVYLNRDMIGAIVGSQPFGGQGLSGTGPKAGGPDYLRTFVNEQTISENTCAVGGNTSLVAPTRKPSTE